MSKPKKSGPAIFMYCVIGITLITSIICFYLYYGNIYQNEMILWIGIIAFTIMYHFGVRIIMGNVSKIFKKHINYRQWWFKEWKEKALTYNPESFSLKKHSLEEIANTMVKSEVDHWINEVISLSTLLFIIPWGKMWAFIISAICAMIFDSQFIIIQRYNRPRIVKIIKRESLIQSKRFNATENSINVKQSC